MACFGRFDAIGSEPTPTWDWVPTFRLVNTVKCERGLLPMAATRFKALLTAPLNRKPGPGLAHRHQLQAVDVDVRRRVHHPEDGVGNVLRLDRLSAGIGRVITRLITAEAH